ncbi:DUF3108 domain-containing protein [Congregibacter brevis]|uniref:DUF3108 domain-containing protein n=1 Tax=Congregibacter brevis TaxID=3081201 RepID=A0ABZ0IA79_9GAMM|nr:DUF3108 domain-containing protein [Congregibacter sp. IMCC45268]
MTIMDRESGSMADQNALSPAAHCGGFAKRAAFALGLALSFSVSSATAQEAAAETQSHRTLTPYDAVYKTSTSGLSIKLRRSLSMDDNGDCRLTSEGKLLVAGISEVSVFTLDEDQIQPRSYVYQLSGPVSRRREVHFDEGSSVIRSLYKKEWYELPKTGETLDRMSQQEQLRLSLLNDPTPREDILFHVADGRKVKEYRLTYQGEERLETPMGWVNTLHFERDHDDPERQSGVWIAPEWDYLMVRTVHIDNGKTTVANLISANLSGTAVTGSSS